MIAFFRLRFAALAMSGLLMLYTASSLYQLELPGLHYDEAFEAVPALQLLRGRPVTPFRESSLTIGGQRFPLMTQDYIGAVNTYLALPFIYIFGPTPVALRLPSVLLGAVALSLTYALTRRLTTSRQAGLAAALLLAVDPTFVFWHRQGIFVTAVTAVIGLGAALCWLRRFQGGARLWSVAGSFLFGLGLYAKFLFLWLIAALAGAILLLYLPRLVRNRSLLKKQVISKTEVFLMVAAFGAGCWPLLLYNIQTGGTWLSISQHAQTSYYGVDNFAFGPNLGERLAQFVTLLTGGHLWYLGHVWRNPTPVAGFGLILATVIYTAWSTRPNDQSRRRTGFLTPLQAALFPFLVIALVLLASVQTVSALWITHFAILTPWPAIAMAAGGWYIVTPKADRRRAKKSNGWRRRLLRPALGIGLALIAGANLLTLVRYHAALTESGGLSAHSDAIYDLSDWLAGRPNRAVVAMDWGLAAPVAYLTNGQVVPVEIFGYAWEADVNLAPRLRRFTTHPETLYLWRAPDEVIFDRSQEFKALYRPHQLEETIEEAFYERSGRPILGVTRLVECGTPHVNAPEPAEHCR